MPRSRSLAEPPMPTNHPTFSATPFSKSRPTRANASLLIPGHTGNISTSWRKPASSASVQPCHVGPSRQASRRGLRSLLLGSQWRAHVRTCLHPNRPAGTASCIAHRRPRPRTRIWTCSPSRTGKDLPPKCVPCRKSSRRPELQRYRVPGMLRGPQAGYLVIHHLDNCTAPKYAHHFCKGGRCGSACEHCIRTALP
jgi:hypothetical protein